MQIPYTYLAVIVLFSLLLGVEIGDRLAAGVGWDRAEPGYLVFNNPGPMEVGREVQVTAIVHDDVEEAIDRLIESFEDGIEGSEKVKQTWTTRRMQAKLHGKDFDIRMAGESDERTIVEGDYAEWIWYVTAKKKGIGKLLRLDLYAIMSSGNEARALRRLRTEREYVNVSIGFWESVTQWAETIIRTANGLVGIGTLLMGIGAVLGWMGRSLFGVAK